MEIFRQPFRAAYSKLLLTLGFILLLSCMPGVERAQGYHCIAGDPCPQAWPPPPSASSVARGFYRDCKATYDMHWTCTQKKGHVLIESQCEEPGCIIGIQNQTLGEEFPVADTPYTLRYQSDRVPGRTGSNFIIFPHGKHFAGWSLNVHHFYDVSNNILYMGNGKIRFLQTTVLPINGEYLVASEGGEVVYIFDGLGRHQRTLETKTQPNLQGNATSSLHAFSYDSQGLLASIDNHGHTTIIQRNPNGLV